MSTEREWKPGDVAMLVGGQRVGLRVPYCPIDAHVSGPHWHTDRGGWTDASLYPARPLVVIDPEDREQIERLADLLARSGAHRGRVAKSAETNAMQAALRSLVEPPEPPKPAEPLGLGAVVEDADSGTHVRVSVHLSNAWHGPDGLYRHYDGVDAVKILSKGVPS